MLKSLYQYKQDLRDKGIFFSFCGPINQDLIIEIGEMLRRKMQMEDVSSPIILKVFAMVIEQSQNIIHYSAERVPEEPVSDEEKDFSFGILTVGMRDGAYFVIGGNKMENRHVPALKEKLELIRGMSREELKAHYRERRKSGPHEGSKGAGLGLIEMARRSSRPLEYHFQEIDDRYTFFSVESVI